MKNVITKKIYIKDIPLLFLQENTEEKPRGVIFLYHGWSSKKENYHFIGSIFAREGYQVIIPDSENHGERGILQYDNEIIMEENFWKTVIQSVDEYFYIKAKLFEDQFLLSDKIFVMGNSMGGIISSGIFVRDHEISSLIVMNGACDWIDLEDRIIESRNINRRKSIDIEILREYNPASNFENFLYRPILLQHGEEDKSVPIKTQKIFFEKIKNYYGDKENRLSFTKVPNLNHHKTTGMIEESLYWLNQISCK